MGSQGTHLCRITRGSMVNRQTPRSYSDPADSDLGVGKSTFIRLCAEKDHCDSMLELLFVFLFVAVVTILIHNGIKKTLPLCLTIKVPFFQLTEIIWPYTYEWLQERRVNNPSLMLAIHWECLQDWWPFLLSVASTSLYSTFDFGSSSLFYSGSIKSLALGLKDSYFWDIGLPSSAMVSFPNKVVFPASTPCLQFTGLLT